MGKAVPLIAFNAVNKKYEPAQKVTLIMRVRLIEESKIRVIIKDVSAWILGSFFN
jgi:hypothetical protein